MRQEKPDQDILVNVFSWCGVKLSSVGEQILIVMLNDSCTSPRAAKMKLQFNFFTSKILKIKNN